MDDLEATRLCSVGPWNCPKGYGICWTCSLPCNDPRSTQTPAQATPIVFTVAAMQRAKGAG